MDLPPLELAPAWRRTPSQQQQAATHAALLMHMLSGPSDPDFANVVLLSTFDGVNGSTTLPNLAGAGVAGPALACVGTCALSNTRSEYGATSLFTSTSNYATTTPASASYILGNKFTIEFSVYVSSPGFAAMFKMLLSGATLFGLLNSALDDPPGFDFTGWAGTTVAFAKNTWHKVAMVSDSTIPRARLYVNGNRVGDTSGSSNSTANTYLELGFNPTGGGALTAYFNNMRVTKNVARYAGTSYTPATGPFPTH